MKAPLHSLPDPLDISFPHAGRDQDLGDGVAMLPDEFVLAMLPADAIRPVGLTVDKFEPSEELSRAALM